jgi:hypothetical protein
MMKAVLDEIKPIYVFTKICGFFPYRLNESGPKITWFNAIYTFIWFIFSSFNFQARILSQVQQRLSTPIVLLGLQTRILLAYSAITTTYVINLVCREKIWRIFTELRRIDEKVMSLAHTELLILIFQIFFSSRQLDSKLTMRPLKGSPSTPSSPFCFAF